MSRRKFSPGSVDACQVAFAAVFEQEQYLVSVRAEARRVDVSVQAFGQYPGRAAGGRGQRQMFDGRTR